VLISGLSAEGAKNTTNYATSDGCGYLSGTTFCD
jgi:hypothetical protein